MDELFQTKMSRCQYYFGNLISCTEIENQCKKQDYKKIEESECANCLMYKSRFIEYPIQVSKIDQKPIDYQDGLYKSYIGKPVKVRLDKRTYLGVFVGDLPTSAYIQHNEQSNVLTVNHITSPAMFVPELNRIVFGHESWWSVIESPEEFKEITDEDIKNTWYVKMAKAMFNPDTQKGE